MRQDGVDCQAFKMIVCTGQLLDDPNTIDDDIRLRGGERPDHISLTRCSDISDNHLALFRCEMLEALWISEGAERLKTLISTKSAKNSRAEHAGHAQHKHPI